MRTTPEILPADDRRRWATLLVVCLAQLMIVLDATIVNVALPAIQRELHFSQADLTWVVNAFLITFGSLLLLAGRMGDLVGRKRVFLVGVVLFTAASALCGAAASQGWLIAARFLQGIGAATQASVILAIIVTEFPRAADRARAMSAYVFVSVAGGSLGLLAGGMLTQALDWHWIFFVNVPIGAVTLVLGRKLIADDRGQGFGRGLDWLGSALVTSSLMVGIYGIIQATSHGWASAQVLGFVALALALMGAFLAWEARTANPIMPLRILRVPGVLSANLIRGLLVTGMYSTFFLGTLYMEHVLHYSATETGAAFLPWTITVAILSRGVTTNLMNRFGAIRVLAAGMTSAAAGLLLFSSLGPDTAFFPTIFLACFLLGLGIGNAFMPLLTIAMADIPAADAGLGSGLTNVAQQVSGALGLAVLGTLATNHTKTLLTEHHDLTEALTGGYHLGFLVAAGAVAIGLALALVLLRGGRPRRAPSRIEPALEPTTELNLEPERQAA